MKKVICLSLMFALGSPFILPINRVLANLTDHPSETLLVRGGGGRSGGSRSVNRSSGGNINRSQFGTNGSGRVNPTPNSGQNFNRNNVNPNNINRTNVNPNNVNRNNINQNNINRNVDRNQINNNRNYNLDNDRNYTNRVNRNVVNTGNRNVVVNPRGWSSWGWNGSRPWVPNSSYWGGGFWGGVALGAVTTGVTSAIINSTNNDEPTYVVIEPNSPGYQLFSSYNLIQTNCLENGNLVYIYGPQNSLMCAIPNHLVSAGYYDVDPEGLVLISR